VFTEKSKEIAGASVMTGPSAARLRRSAIFLSHPVIFSYFRPAVASTNSNLSPMNN